MANSSIHVLLVEDNPGDADLVKEYLAEPLLGSPSQGGSPAFGVTTVDRLSACLHELSQVKPDVILLDLSLPDSTDALTFCKVREAAPRVPIILLTGNAASSLATLLVQNGAQDYLIKGQVDAQLLQRAIYYSIERQRLVLKLQDALAQISTLRGLLPMCSGCKKIRNDKGYWQHVEQYLQAHADVSFTHGLCPDCIERYYPDL